MTTLATLIILGASVRAAAESAVRGGFEPYGIDLFADADLQALGRTRKIERYPAEFLRALNEAPDAPWIYTGGLENYPRLITRLSKLRPLLGNEAATLSLVRDPQWLERVLQGSAVRFPETRTNRDFAPLDGDWLVKPRRSGGGMGIRKSGVRGHETGVRSRVYQRLVEGDPFSASFLATIHEVQWIGAAGQWVGRSNGAPQPFQYAGSFAPAVVSQAEQESLRKVAELLVRESGLRGLFGLDLIRSADGLWLLEVNPRYTASMELLEAMQGRSLVAEHCAAMDCEFLDSKENAFSKQLSTGDSTSTEGAFGFETLRKPLSKLLSTSSERMDDFATQGKLIVYADSGGLAGSRCQDELAIIRQELGVIAADIPPAMSVISQESPVCTLMAAGKTVAEVQRLLSTAARRVRESLEPPREAS